ncbi:MAG TPA: transketolase [Actinomycetota bacterium]|nr:transketolase [Actinomycetota bacterium]
MTTDTATGTDLERLAIDTVRTLAMDAIQKAGDGHPGTAMALAPAAYVLWTRFLTYDPEDPDWFDRDRFVLSNGHASVLQYTALHLTGYDLGIDDLKQQRQWGSRTPGHPEHFLTPGIEVTTGPLGQGVGNAVGFAIAERFLAHRYNRPGHEVVNHRTWAFCSDGDMMEGISSEASSIAGFLRLGKLTFLYDDNHITIDGRTEITFGEDVEARYRAYGWHTVAVEDANDTEAIAAAYQAALDEPDRPTFIRLRSHIAWGAPHAQDTAKAHGAALGEEEVRATKQVYGWDPDKHFYVPDGVYDRWRVRVPANQAARAAWQRRVAAYDEAEPELAAELRTGIAGKLPDGWDAELDGLVPEPKKQATRTASNTVMNAIARRLPTFLGGSADLAESNKTDLEDAGDMGPDEVGRNLHYGIREHAMGAISNGLALHGGLRPFAATFLIFSDYMRPSVRLASLMGLPVVYVWTHDSIGLGGDGPTHQPVEHLASLRAMPVLRVIRPADGPETVEAWRAAIQRTDGPTGLALTRQDLPPIDRDRFADASGLHRGAYVLADAEPLPGGAQGGGPPELLLIATGSEVWVALEARERLQAEGIATRVVSMPCWELFAEQDQGYRDDVLPPAVRARVSVEAAATFGWDRWVGEDGEKIGVDRFGASAPGAIVLEQYGFTPDNVTDRARRLLQRLGRHAGTGPLDDLPA